MPPEAQTRLLRVLQDGEYLPVGANRPVKANVRIIAATNHNHVLVLGGQVLAVLEIGIEQALGVVREEIHREMNAL